MVVVGAVMVALVATATLVAAWMTAWASWTRVALFLAFAASAVVTAAAAAHRAGDSTLAASVAATTLTATVVGLARMATVAEGPPGAQGAKRRGRIGAGLGRRRRWRRFERSFWLHVEDSGGASSKRRSLPSRSATKDEPGGLSP